MLEIFGILAVVAMVITLFVRPSGIVPVVLAIGVVGAAIVVNWNYVERSRAQRAAATTEQQHNSSAAVTVPPAGPTRAGS